jgi:glycerol dehydrogenase-like iron-containing ADH family enzyme
MNLIDAPEAAPLVAGMGGIVFDLYEVVRLLQKHKHTIEAYALSGAALSLERHKDVVTAKKIIAALEVYMLECEEVEMSMYMADMVYNIKQNFHLLTWQGN